jgi:hypothetical protein
VLPPTSPRPMLPHTVRQPRRCILRFGRYNT